MFEVFGGAQIIYSGDKIPDGEGAIVFGNHVSNCDSVFILGLLLRKGLSGSLHFMAKKTLMYFPFIGWSFKIAKLGVFMSRNWDQDREHIEKSFEAITESEIPCCMGLMPEGTRITEKKRQDAIHFCNAKNIEPLNQVLVPRPRGFRAVVNSLRKSNIKYIYDFTFCYIDGVIRIRDFVFSSIRGRRILVNIKRIPLDQVPQDDQGIQNWLLDRFRRKDILITGAAKAKQFEGETKQSEPLRIQIITKTKKQ
jgi:1-acyl-sn-glycerol-3-phosphate acyltransferase